MNIDVKNFYGDREWTDEEKEMFQIIRENNINILRERRRVKEREKAKETVLKAAAVTALIAILGVAAAIGLKKEEKAFSEHAFTEKDAPYNVNITDEDIAEAERYYEEHLKDSGRQR
ncbi:MAG TPA: hypothetical protein GXZ95_03970 [Mollicutes bacterium]|nr:hypothetical protein [Mollicutes bacterium]